MAVELEQGKVSGPCWITGAYPSNRLISFSNLFSVVDDGTGVMDCAIKYDKGKPHEARSRDDIAIPVYRNDVSTSLRFGRPKLPDWSPRFPLPEIGDIVKLTGTICPRFRSRAMEIQSLGGSARSPSCLSIFAYH